MAPRISAEMLRAIQMIKDGANRYVAAKATGLTISAITRSKLYQELIASQGTDNEKPEGNRRASAQGGVEHAPEHRADGEPGGDAD